MPKHCGVWDSSKAYEPLSIVLEESSGDSYISRKDVPAGTGLTQTSYWALCARFSEQAAQLREDTADSVAAMEQRTSAAESLTNSNKSQLETLVSTTQSSLEKRMTTIESRLDSNVKASTDSSADYAAEVADARVSSESRTYGSVGTHLRTIETGYGLSPSFSANVSFHCTSNIPLVLIEFEDNVPVYKLNEAHTAQMLLFYNRAYLYPFYREELTLSQETDNIIDYNYFFLDVKEKVIHIVKPSGFTSTQSAYPNAVYVGFVKLVKDANGNACVQGSYCKTVIPVGTVDSYGNYTLADRVENELYTMRKNYLDNHAIYGNAIWNAVLLTEGGSQELNKPFLQIKKKYSKEMLEKGDFKTRVYFEINPTCVANKDKLLVFYNDMWSFWDTSATKLQLLSWDEESNDFVEVEYLENTDFWYINCKNNVFQVITGGQYMKYNKTHKDWWSCGYFQYAQDNCVLPIEYIDLWSYYPRVRESIPLHDRRNHMMGYLYSTVTNMTFDVDTFEISGATHVITPIGYYTTKDVRYVGRDDIRSDTNKYLYLVFYPSSKIMEWVSADHFALGNQQYFCIFLGMAFAGSSYAYFNGANVKLKGAAMPKITVIGDSISTFQGYLSNSAYAVYYRSGGPITVWESWWMRLVSNLNAGLFSNMSSSGSRVTTTLDTTSQPSGVTRSKIVKNSDGESPDIVIIYLGTNDWAANVAVGTYNGRGAVPTDGSTFREAYAMMLDNITSGSPKAKVFCCTLLDRERGDSDKSAPEVNGSGVYLSEYNDAIKEIADVFNAEVIDLHTCGINHHNMSAYMADYNTSSGSGLHPNSAGHDLMYRKIRQSVEPYVDGFNRNKLPWSQHAEPNAGSGMTAFSAADFVYEDDSETESETESTAEETEE